MSTKDYSDEELVRLVTKLVVEQIRQPDLIVPVGVSNRHIHLDRADMDALFGPSSELTRKKDLGQPGQFAAEESVTLKGPKGSLNRVRVLGPLRGKTQIEISISDGFALGIQAPVKESGKIEGTPGIEIIGPKGTVTKSQGTIVALRHIHMTPDTARHYGLKDKDMVEVELGGLRGAVLKNVLIRVSDTSALEMHIDVEEANAVGVKNGDAAKVVRK